MKRLMNAVETMLDESLDGFAAAHADIVELGAERKFVRRRALNRGKVALISGGGSGHEPLHAGFVGFGMLDAACPGQVFTSPTPDQMVAAIEAVDTGAGCLLIVKNYEGDVMNFEMAGELAVAGDRKVETVVTNDDVAVPNSTWSTGRRGVAGTLVVEKIVGAAAEQSMALEDLRDLGREVNERTRLVRDRVDSVYRAGGWQAHVLARPRRNGSGGRHPRRARPSAHNGPARRATKIGVKNEIVAVSASCNCLSASTTEAVEPNRRSERSACRPGRFERRTEGCDQGLATARAMSAAPA